MSGTLKKNFIPILFPFSALIVLHAIVPASRNNFLSPFKRGIVGNSYMKMVTFMCEKGLTLYNSINSVYFLFGFGF